MPLTYANRDRRLGKHMQALGYVINSWASLEQAVSQATWELGNIEKGAGACFTAQYIGPGPRGRALVALIRYRGGSGDLVDEFNRFVRTFGELGAKRNRMAHDPWGVKARNQSIERLNITADKKLNYDFHPAPIGELTAFFEQIEATTVLFWKLWNRALAELPPWPRTQFEQSPGIVIRHTDPDSAR